MKRTFEDYLNDILEAITAIEAFTSGMTKEDFIGDLKTVYATRKAIEIIGEAAKKIPVSFKNRHKEIPWKEIAGMRDVLVHEYFGVDLDVVWKTVQQDIPALKSLFLRLRDDLKPNKEIDP